jgi:hypothetical protein
MIHVSPAAIWECSLPNGNYSVTVCMGDPSYPKGTENVQAEDTTIISNALLSDSNKWIEKSANITVTDEKLTISFTSSTDPARLCWIKITPQ